MLRKYFVKAWANPWHGGYYGSTQIAKSPKEAIEKAKVQNILLFNWGYEVKSLGKV